MVSTDERPHEEKSLEASRARGVKPKSQIQNRILFENEVDVTCSSFMLPSFSSPSPSPSSPFLIVCGVVLLVVVGVVVLVLLLRWWSSSPTNKMRTTIYGLSSYFQINPWSFCKKKRISLGDVSNHHPSLPFKESRPPRDPPKSDHPSEKVSLHDSLEQVKEE